MSTGGEQHAPPGDPSYDGFRISKLWAWTSIDPVDDQEGILGFRAPAGMTPMIASDRVRLDSLRPYAQVMADQLGVEVRLREFGPDAPVEPVEVLTPRAGR